MNKKQIQLTEQDIHFLVEDAVRNYLINEGIDEGFWGGLGALGSKLGNSMARGGQRMANSVGNKWNKAKNAIGNKMTQAGQAMGQAYNNVKNTYQTGSANQDAQKAITNAVNALNALKAADQKLQGLGQASVLGKQAALIDQLLASLNGGATSISGRFKARRGAMTN